MNVKNEIKLREITYDKGKNTEFENLEKDFELTKEKWYQNTTFKKYIVFPSIPLFALFIISELYPNALFLDGIWHFNFEIFAVVFNSLIAAYCISRYRNSNDTFFFFLGVGFLASGTIDFLHAIVSISSIDQTPFLSYFIPQTWAAGRIIDAAMMIIVFLKYIPLKLEEVEITKKTRKSLAYAVGTVSVLVIGTISFSLFSPLPNIISGSFINRPYDAIAACVFVIALYFFFSKGFHRNKDIFFKGIAGYLVLSIFGEIVISSSSTNFDTPFNIAHILKDVAYLLIVIVLTQSLQQQSSLKQRLLDELKKNERQKDEFLAMISHELKTPISPITLWADALKEPDMLGSLNEEQKNAVDKISISAGELDRLVNDIFDSYKIELGKLNFNSEIINSQEIINQVVENMSKISTNNVQIINSSKSNISMYSDKLRIIQVLKNLVNNSLDYVPKVNGRIEINVSEKSNSIEFYVKDNGIGIHSDLQKYLFKKFYQTDTSFAREHGGTGLGLSICRGIVEGLGGKIWFKSDLRNGTTFYFTVPKILDSGLKLQKRFKADNYHSNSKNIS